MLETTSTEELRVKILMLSKLDSGLWNMPKVKFSILDAGAYSLDKSGFIMGVT